MVVTLPLRLSALLLLYLPVALSQAPGRFVPSDLPCLPTLTFKLSPIPDKPQTSQPTVTIGERTLSSNYGDGALTVFLKPDSDCGKSLNIAPQGTQPQTFKIAPAPFVDDADIQKSLATYFTSHPINTENPTSNLYTLIIVTVTALCGIALLIWTWSMQSNAKSARKAREQNIGVGKSVKELVEDLDESVGKLKKIPESLDKLTGVTGSISTKLDTVMRTLADARKQTGPNVADQPKAQNDPAPAYKSPVPTKSSNHPSATSFAADYNAALLPLGQENSLLGVKSVIPVHPRPSEAGDKNPNAIEPLIANPSGDLRVFLMASLPPTQAYLAPSLERCAAGIGGTHKRIFAAFFDFSGETDATRLDKPAIVTRINDQWEFYEKGQMS